MAQDNRVEDLIQRVAREYDDLSRQLKLIAQYITEHRQQMVVVRIRDVADAVGLSPSYLSSLFSKYVQESFTDYLVRRRMMEAQNLLSNTDDCPGNFTVSVFDDAGVFSDNPEVLGVKQRSVPKIVQFHCNLRRPRVPLSP